MKIIVDRQKISRRAWVANVLSLGGMFTLLASIVLPLFRPQASLLGLPMMLLGLLIAMVGIYLANRWVKKPRPEDRLDAALKSLSDGYRLYHYPALPLDHVLLTPGSVIILETVNLDGHFILQNGRWKEKMTLGRALRWVVEEHLGNPVKAALSGEAFLQRRLAESGAGGVDIPLRSIVVFTHPASVIDVSGETAVTVVKVEKLKKHIQEKGKRLPLEAHEQVEALLEGIP
jgi:hypothetical protein